MACKDVPIGVIDSPVDMAPECEFGEARLVDALNADHAFARANGAGGDEAVKVIINSSNDKGLVPAIDAAADGPADGR